MSTSVAYVLMQMPAPSEVFLAVEVNALIRAGVDVKVFCLRPRHVRQDKLLSDQELTGVSIYFFDWLVLRDACYCIRRSPGILWHMIVLIFRTCWLRPVILIKSLVTLAKSFSIARRVLEEQIPIIHAAWGHYPAITAYLIKRLMPDVQFTLALGAYDRLMQHPMTPIAAQRATCILTQSEASAELIRNQWPKSSRPIFVISRGIDLETIGSFRKVSGKVPGLIASVGRLIEAKGHEYVVEAFAKVRHLLPDSRLVFMGDGDDRARLERLVGALGLTDSVEFAGHLSQPELFRRVCEASVFVLASKSENLPNSVKEAMAAGVPVIATPTTGLAELVQDGVTGCVVPMENAEAIANAIIRIMTDQAFAERLTREAMRLVEEKFDIRRTTEQRKRLFFDLAEQHEFLEATEVSASSPRHTLGVPPSSMTMAAAKLKNNVVAETGLTNKSYAEWLRTHGAPIFEGAGRYWQLNSGALTPATAGPCFLERLSTLQAGSLLKESRAWFLRYSSNPCDEPTEWWHVISDGYDVGRLSASTRSKLNRGNRNCNVRRLEPEWLAEHGYGCYESAYGRYNGVTASSEERFRHNIKKTIEGPFEYWGVFVDERLSGYCQCIIEGRNVATNVIKFDPTDLRRYTSYALFGAVLEHYVNGQGMTVSNGTRSIAHETNIQDFLVKFGFRKQFCRLNVVYQPWLATAARAAFPFRKAIASLPGNGISHKLRVFLFQEELKRLCR